MSADDGGRAPWWQYRARPDPRRHKAGVVDGDTLDVVLDQGLDNHRHERLRLKDVDTAETYGVSKDSDEYQRGQEHKRFVLAWLDHAVTEWDGTWPVVVQTDKDESGKYGRYRAVVYRRCDGDWLIPALTAEYPEVSDE